jgi:hypothetical protein
MSGPKWACLGAFTSTSNKCGQYTSGTFGLYYPSSSSPDVSTLGNTPANSGKSIGSVVGPLVYVRQTNSTAPFQVYADFLNYFEGSCPKDFTDVTTSATYASLIPAGNPNGVHLCQLESPQLTYSPS